MKIKIDIDCTPQEARTFFGLPDVEPMQEALLARMQERMMQSLETMDPDAMMKLWLPGGLEGFGQMQEKFWGQFLGAAKPGRTKGSDKPRE